MSCGSRPDAWILAFLLAACVPGQVLAQGWTETQVWAVAVASRPGFAGAGFGLASRDASRSRLGAAAAAGLLESGGAAGRLELAWHFLLDPVRTRGAAVYGGGGLVLASGEGGRLRARLQLTIGAESGPAARRGTFVEVGVGGGARLAAGVRLRTRRAPPSRAGPAP